MLIPPLDSTQQQPNIHFKMPLYSSASTPTLDSSSKLHEINGDVLKFYKKTCNCGMRTVVRI